jgi:tryptophan-rich sensory protein
MAVAIGSGWRRDLGAGLVMLLAVAAASVVGQIATFPNLSPWYASLAKPDFNPPNSIFGPVWTTLYVLMAFAGWRILRLRPGTHSRRVGTLRPPALALFFLQLILNAAWPWMFFAMHDPLLGLVNIVPQFLLVIATITAFQRLDGLAALCLVPLAAWVGFASALNFAIWRLNG